MSHKLKSAKLKLPSGFKDKLAKIYSDNKNSFNLYLSISFLIHGLIAALFLLANYQRDITRLEANFDSIKDQDLTEVSLLDTEIFPNQKPSHVTDAELSKKVRLNKKINFLGKSSAEILNDKLESKGSEPHFADNDFVPTKENYDTFSEHGALGYLNKGGIEKIFENNNFYLQLWRKVRSLTSYPQDFANYQLQGRIRVDLIVDNKGQIVGDFLKVSSSNPVLEMYSLTVLTIALKNPLHKNFWSKDKQIPISFDFEYNLIRDPLEQARVENNMGHYNANIFHFVSNRYVPTKFEQTIADFYRDYVPPVLMTPAGGFVDLIRLYEFYQKWKTGDWRTSGKKRKDNVASLKSIILFAVENPSESLLKRINSNSIPRFRKNHGGITDPLHIPDYNNPPQNKY